MYHLFHTIYPPNDTKNWLEIAKISNDFGQFSPVFVQFSPVLHELWRMDSIDDVWCTLLISKTMDKDRLRTIFFSVINWLELFSHHTHPKKLRAPSRLGNGPWLESSFSWWKCLRQAQKVDCPRNVMVASSQGKKKKIRLLTWVGTRGSLFSLPKHPTSSIFCLYLEMTLIRPNLGLLLVTTLICLTLACY